MLNMKKSIVFLLSAVMAVTMIGCGNDKEASRRTE